MFEELGLEGWTPLAASVVLGLMIGGLFGVLAQRSRFCLRRGLVGSDAERSSALGVWLMALAVAVAGTTAIVEYGFVDLSATRFQSQSLPLVAILLGGLLFGIGMVLTRGCTSRLTVLAGTGNLRAVLTLLVFAIAAHATLKGVLAPARTWLGGMTVDLQGPGTLAALAGSAIIPAAIVAAVLVFVAIRSRAGIGDLVMGALIGVLVPLGWIGTGYLLADEFDPITLESLAFTSAASDTLFWTVAGTAIAPGFGVGVLGGTVLGALLASVAFGEFSVVGFTKDTPTGNYIVGGVLMGVGGVLAGGCTIGAGLTGVSALGISAILALLAIVAGGLLAGTVIERRAGITAGLVPAE
ncbi:MAG: YeeE/YedE family protein [Alphaproteobacteria bacterium]|nr:YeeE/YedE family protein [Alphaproteobacteria bacterium]